jgi:hypothetical protein
MSKLSKSPERNTFLEEYIKRTKKKGKEPNPAYLEMWENFRKIDAEREVDPEWQKDNLEYDLRSTQWICDKVKASDVYAQNLYAAMCNMQFQQLEVIPILKDDRWSCSWRYAGGIIADMRESGDYIDWYCSGIGGAVSYDDTVREGYVPEGMVTDEIREDLKKLGWVPVEWSKDE